MNALRFTEIYQRKQAKSRQFPPLPSLPFSFAGCQYKAVLQEASTMAVTDVIKGFHHITVGVGGAQEDIDFTTKVLGLRMIKQTVLFDGASSIYHLYYGNGDADVGSVWTTFPFKQAGLFGRTGTGQIKTTGFSVPSTSLNFWAEHLDANGVKHSEIQERFGERFIEFEHPSGLSLAVVGCDDDPRTAWGHAVPAEHGIRGFYNVTIACRDLEEQEFFLGTVMNFTRVGQEGPVTRYRMGDGGYNRIIDLYHMPDTKQGSWGFAVGIPHHYALAVEDDEENGTIKAYVEGFGFTDVSEIKDRNYFHSTYTRTPAGVVQEVATSNIGFAIDEPADRLGEQLLLPPWFEERRAEIVAQLEPITVPDYLRVR
jgi:catechol 2,3-dioxygenase-like lactoylglutathione lyase family enzyme